MNPFARALILTFAFAFGTASAGAQTRILIKSDRTNVRAKPSLDAEILASLNSGVEVKVMGEVIPPKSRESWTRIAMPDDVTVWVYGQLVDTKNNLVRSKELNYRAGPGRNYSVLGVLKQGDTIKFIREFDGWVQIEPPSAAVAYVASRLLVEGPILIPAITPVPTPVSTPVSTPVVTSESDSPPPVAAPEPTRQPPFEVAPTSSFQPTFPKATTTTPSPTSVPPPETTSAVLETPAPFPTESLVVDQSVTEIPVDPNSTTDGTARPIPLGSPRARNDMPPAPSPNVVLTEVPGLPELVDANPRFVVREGNVHPTLSIQAPTDFELRNGFYHEGALDYLYFEPQTELRQYRGKRVMVSGHEYHDSRWILPVLKVESIQLVR